MLLDEAGEVVEMFRSSFPLSFLFFVPLLILISPYNTASAAHDFAVYRMQQYDLQGVSHGTVLSDLFCCINYLEYIAERHTNKSFKY